MLRQNETLVIIGVEQQKSIERQMINLAIEQQMYLEHQMNIFQHQTEFLEMLSERLKEIRSVGV